MHTIQTETNGLVYNGHEGHAYLVNIAVNFFDF